MSLLLTVGTPDAGKAAARVGAVQIALHDFFEAWPEEPIFLLKAALVFGPELIEQHPEIPAHSTMIFLNVSKSSRPLSLCSV